MQKVKSQKMIKFKGDVAERVFLRSQNFQRMNQMLEKSSSIILITSTDQYMEAKNLFAVSHWLIGQQVNLNDISKPIFDSPTNQYPAHLLSVKNKQFMYMICKNNCLVCCIDISSWHQIEKQKEISNESLQELIQKSFLIQELFDSINKNKTPVKLWSTFLFESKERSQGDTLKKQKLRKISDYFIVSDCGVIQLCSEKENNVQNFLTAIKKSNEKKIEPFQKPLQLVKSMKQYKKQLHFDIFQNLKDKVKRDLKANFSQQFGQIQENLIQFLEIIFQGLKKSDKSSSMINISEKFQKTNRSLLSFLQNKFITKFQVSQQQNIIISYYKEVKPKYCKSFIPHHKYIPQSLVHLYYFSQLKKIGQQLVGILSKEGKKAFLMTILKDILSMIKEFFLIETQTINQIYSWLQHLLKQLNIIKNISNADQTINKQIQGRIKAILKQKERLSEVILNIDIQQQGPGTYEYLLQLLKDNFSLQEYQQNSRIAIKGKKNYWEMKVKKKFAEENMQINQGKSRRQIGQSILALFQIHQSQKDLDKKYHEEFEFNKLLGMCANRLRTVGMSDLALQIYKKLKMYLKAEECISQIALCLNEKERADLYFKESKYFLSIANKTLSEKYLQKAYEEDIDQMQRLIEMKHQILSSKDMGETQKNLINEIKKGEKSTEDYLRIQFDQEFKKKINAVPEILQSTPEQEVKVFFSQGIVNRYVENE